MKTKLLWMIFLGMNFLAAKGLSQNIYINEIMSSNGNFIADSDGDFPDWIELYNAEAFSVSLADWHLSDKEDNLTKWQFPEIEIPPNGFLLVFASDKDRNSASELHTNFKISAEGESLFLVRPNVQIQDQFPPIALTTDFSFGRTQDGQNDLGIFQSPSPGQSNTSTTNSTFDQLHFSHESGWYTNTFELQIESDSGYQIFYTTDGSLPTPNSNSYQSSITIDNPKDKPNQISMISTSPEFWSPPNGTVNKINIIRLASFQNNIRRSEIYNKSYLIDPRGSERYAFPIVSLITDEKNLFDENIGLMVYGSEEIVDGIPNYNQRGRMWERPIHLAYFDESGNSLLSQNAGMRIHGNFSRQLPQKSIRLYARSDYGNAYFNQTLFDQKPGIEKYKRLILRTCNPNNFHIPFKDELSHLLIRELGMDYQAFTPVIVFINGAYWGIYNLKERQDEYYIEANKNISIDDVELFEKEGELISGSQDTYEDFKAIVELSDFSNPEDYEQLKSEINIDNFIRFLVAQTYFELWDFPEQNLRFWTTQERKWEWLFNDGDTAFNDYWKSKLLEILLPEGTGAEGRFFTLLVEKLFKSQEFKNEFYYTLTHLLNTTFSPKNVISKIDSLDQLYAPLMPEHIARWNYPENINNYHAAVAHIKRFAALRPATLIRDMSEFLPQPLSVFPNPAENSIQVQLFEKDLPPNAFFEIIDFNGRTLSQGNLTQPYIFINHLHSGTYLIRLRDKGVIYTTTFLKL